ncbi:hypothetical protein [Nonomuraea sediminis]|uniref:hypothetical protein n=1 Tax=Nonomuraea sediminis TaxID=2835864 RepID=UPI001BDC7907|nr:hypothetical protein [Nonomuraea sediminis]
MNASDELGWDLDTFARAVVNSQTMREDLDRTAGELDGSLLPPGALSLVGETFRSAYNDGVRGEAQDARHGAASADGLADMFHTSAMRYVATEDETRRRMNELMQSYREELSRHRRSLRVEGPPRGDSPASDSWSDQDHLSTPLRHALPAAAGGVALAQTWVAAVDKFSGSGHSLRTRYVPDYEIAKMSRFSKFTLGYARMAGAMSAAAMTAQLIALALLVPSDERINDVLNRRRRAQGPTPEIRPSAVAAGMVNGDLVQWRGEAGQVATRRVAGFHNTGREYENGLGSKTDALQSIVGTLNTAYVVLNAASATFVVALLAFSTAAAFNPALLIQRDTVAWRMSSFLAGSSKKISLGLVGLSALFAAALGWYGRDKLSRTDAKAWNRQPA